MDFCVYDDLIMSCTGWVKRK